MDPNTAGHRLAARTPSRVRLRRAVRRATLGVALVAGLSLAMPGYAVQSAAQPQPSAAHQRGLAADSQEAATYTNPVGASAGDDLADPSIIRGRDGYWYVYATQTLLNEGSDQVHRLPIVRSKDLVNWEHVGDVFDEDNWPSWLGPQSGVWDAAVKYWNGKYRLYFTGANAPDHETPNRVIGVATAPTPAGPWTDSGEILLGPDWYTPPAGQRSFQAIISPNMITGTDGNRYLYYGAYKGGVWGVQLSDDGMETVGEPTRLVGEMHLEGAYVVYRDGWYYLFASSDGCCTGPVSGYRGYVARSKDPLGPFVDRDGVPIDALRPGGTPMVGATGNSWVGTGANAIVTDLSGQDWLAYHAVDRHQPYLNGPFQGGTRRGLLIDRLDWIEGWPTVRGGAGASDEPVPAPEAAGLVADAFENGPGIGQQWQRDTAGWRVQTEPAGGFVGTNASNGERVLSARRGLPPDVRVRGAVRLPEAGDGGSDGVAGFVLNQRGEAGSARVLVDASENALVIDARAPGRDRTRVVEPLPDSFAFGSWHDLAVQVRDQSVRVELSTEGLNDPLAVAETDLPDGLVAGHFGLFAQGAQADFDDVTAARLYRPHNDPVPDPEVGAIDTDYSDEFRGDSLADHWSWIREPAAELAEGSLEYPVLAGNITRGNANAPPLLVRDAPDGEQWTLETKLQMPLGEDPLHGFPMAGMLLHTDDDDYLRVAAAGHTDVRYVRINREIVYHGRILYGTSWTGPTGADSTWLRLRYSRDPDTGEQRLRGASSTDGDNWTWGAVYTMPADQEFRVGLMTGGASGQDRSVTANFDYLRLHRP